MTPDVNVFVAASRSDHPHYAAARAWLEQATASASQGTALNLQPMVVASEADQILALMNDGPSQPRIW